MWAPERLLSDLERLALHAPTRAEFFDEAAVRLKRAVPFDGACWHTLDPGSDLITQHRLQDIPDRFPILANNEYAVEDVNKFEQLAHAERKAATLTDATAGHPERSPRFRDLLTPAGLGPELRSAFVADGATWGALILVRRAGQPEFEERDVELLCNASALLARAVRRGLITEGCEAETVLPDAPGVIELDAHGGLLRASSSAEPLLAELSGATVEDGVRSSSIHAIASATRATIATTSNVGTATLPRSVVKTPAGTWLVLHGGLLGAPRSGRGRDLHSACPPDPRRSAPAQGLRPHPARAGCHPTDPPRRDHDPGRGPVNDLAPHHQRSLKVDLRQDRRPYPRRTVSQALLRRTPPPHQRTSPAWRRRLLHRRPPATRPRDGPALPPLRSRDPIPR